MKYLVILPLVLAACWLCLAQNKSPEAQPKVFEIQPAEPTGLKVASLTVDANGDAAFVFDAVGWPTNKNLFELRCEGKAVVEIRSDGEVVYDTNHVTQATRLFWRELSALIREQSK